jgi:hypothetical protein
MRSDHLAKHAKTHTEGKKSGSGSDTENGNEQTIVPKKEIGDNEQVAFRTKTETN